MELTEKRRAVFLEELSAHGIVSRAARRASPHATSGAVQTFRDARASDPDFAAAWDAALEDARAAVEYELHRRAVEGWEEPIYCESKVRRCSRHATPYEGSCAASRGEWRPRQELNLRPIA